jgi:H+/Cl- antiporter ClcA
MAGLGKLLVFAGIMVVIIGLITWLAGDKVSWFGNLPGDIRIQKKNVTFYFPLVSMILISVAISLFLWIIRRLF